MKERQNHPKGFRVAGVKVALARLAAAMVSMLALSVLAGCTTPLEFGSGAVKITMEEGSGWLHKHPLFLGLSMYTPPQIAVWVEEPDGTYVSTILVTKKSATQAWLTSAGEGLSAAEIRRPEALPAWSHRRGIVYSDGLYMPTAAEPVVDAVTSATPKEGFSLALEATSSLRQFRILVEINQSLDFNETYPAGAVQGESGYSGGAFGSGQPSLVYYADIDLDSAVDSYAFALLGQGSAAGSDGAIVPVSGITDAMNIMGRVMAEIAR